MAVTIRQVAKACGVSPYTVSSVLNGKGRVSKETRQRVMKAINQLGYNPVNNVPLAAKRGGVKKLGFVIPFEDAAAAGFYYRASQAADTIAKELDIPLVQTSEHQLSQWLDGKEDLQAAFEGMDHVIFFAPKFNWQDLIERLRERDIKVALIRRHSPQPGVLSITDDDAQGMRSLVEHLAGLGHRCVGLLGQIHKNAIANQRLKAFHDALEEFDLIQDERLVIPMSHHNNKNGLPTFEEALIPQLKAIHDAGLPLTGLIVQSDQLFTQVLALIQQAGWAIPNDIAVCGYCDELLAQQSSPPVTTLQLPIEEMVKFSITAFSSEFSLLRQSLFANTLVVRESTVGKTHQK